MFMSEQQPTITTEPLGTEINSRLDSNVPTDIVGSTVVNLAFDSTVSRLAYAIDQETGSLTPTTLLTPSMREDTVLTGQQDLLMLSGMGDSAVPVKELKSMTGKSNIGRVSERFPGFFEKIAGEDGPYIRKTHEYTVSSVIPWMMDPEFVSDSYKAAKIDYRVNNRTEEPESLFEQSGTAGLVKLGARNYLVPLFKEIATDEGQKTVPDTDAVLYLNLLKAAQNIVANGKYNIRLRDLAQETFTGLSEEEMWVMPEEEIPSYSSNTNIALNKHIEEVLRSFSDEGIHYLRGSVAKELFTITGPKTDRKIRIAAEIDDLHIVLDPSDSDLGKESISVTGRRVGHSEYHMPAELPGEGDLRSMSVQEMNELYIGLLEGRGRELSNEGYSPQDVRGALKSIRAEMKQRGAHPDVLGFGNILKTKRVGGMRKSSGHIDPGNMNKRA